MNVLGLETSCDETSAAVVRDGRTVLSNVVFSQEKMHRPFRGVVPEIASRAHVETVNGIVERALRDAFGKSAAARVDAIAVTVGPGLIGSLLVGRMTAEALGWAWGKPVTGVNHLEGHLLSALLDHPDLSPPFLGLVVSGGHTDLVRVEDFGTYRVLGRTRDDSAGEAFDKVANLLKLGYPGGPVIDRLARGGNPEAVRFPRPYLPGSWDFSFSGLKTAVLYHLRGRGDRPLSPRETADLCASFQAAVVDVLVRKALLAAAKEGLGAVAVGGGVSANSLLRARLESAGRAEGLRVHFPSRPFSTDNAAMIAAAGYFKLEKGGPRGEALSVDPALALCDWR